MQVADQPERRVVLVSLPCNLACHLVSSLSSVLSTTVDNKSQGKNYTTHKLLTYLRFDENPSAEFPAIAEGSAHILGTTVRGAGSALGRTDATRWEQIHSSKSLFEKYQAASRLSIKRVIATYTNVSLVVGNSS